MDEEFEEINWCDVCDNCGFVRMAVIEVLVGDFGSVPMCEVHYNAWSEWMGIE